MSKNIEKLEAAARKANADLRAARRDKARREKQALLSAYEALGQRVSAMAGADTAESVQALSERLTDDAIRDLVQLPTQPENPQWGFE